ncbi:hypothetical protein VPHF99_0059 [Vibrio phage F99]
MLTVTGVSDKGEVPAIFSVECSVCSKDQELWPFGSIKVTKDGLSRYHVPCGCSKAVQWNEKQLEVIVSRLCKTLGYTFKGFCGVFSGMKSKMILENNCTGNVWNTTTVKNFLNGSRDPKASGKHKWTVQEREYQIQERLLKLQGKFLKWEGIYKGPLSKFSWLCKEGHTCQTSVGSFLNAKVGCNVCSGSVRWSVKERVTQISELLSSVNGKFKGWLGSNNYENTQSVLKWECDQGHDCTTKVHDFVYGGVRCATCYKEHHRKLGYGYGYFPHRSSEQDNLYIIRFKRDETIKVGRAFDMDNRIHTSNGLLKSSNHKLEDIEILKTFTGTHQEVWDTEQWVHEELTERGFHAHWITWTQECFTEDSEELIYRLLDESGLVEGEW